MAARLSGTISALDISNARLERALSKKKSLEKMRRRFVSGVSLGKQRIKNVCDAALDFHQVGLRTLTRLSQGRPYLF